MTTITLKTSRPNRQTLSQAFGENQTAVRFLEAMATDITVTLPDAIEAGSAASALLYAQMLHESIVSAPARSMMPIQMAVDSLVSSPSPAIGNGMRALMTVGGYTAQAPGSYRSNATNAAFQQGSATGVSLTSGATATIVSLTLAAGTWDLSGVIVFNSAASTVIEQLTAGVSTTAATLGTADTYQQYPEALSGAAAINIQAPLTRVTLSTAQTVYLVAQAIFTTSTMSADGYIKARPGL